MADNDFCHFGVIFEVRVNIQETHSVLSSSWSRYEEKQYGGFKRRDMLLPLGDRAGRSVQTPLVFKKLSKAMTSGLMWNGGMIATTSYSQPESTES